MFLRALSWLPLAVGLSGCVTPTAVYLLNRSPVPLTVRLLHRTDRPAPRAVLFQLMSRLPRFDEFRRMTDSLRVAPASDTVVFELPAGAACFLDYRTNALPEEALALRVYKRGHLCAAWPSTRGMLRTTDAFGKSTIVLAVD